MIMNTFAPHSQLFALLIETFDLSFSDRYSDHRSQFNKLINGLDTTHGEERFVTQVDAIPIFCEENTIRAIYEVINILNLISSVGFLRFYITVTKENMFYIWE